MITSVDWTNNLDTYKCIISNQILCLTELSDIGSVKYQEEYERFRLSTLIVSTVSFDCLNDGDADRIDDFINIDCCNNVEQQDTFSSPSQLNLLITDNGEYIVTDSLDPILAE